MTLDTGFPERGSLGDLIKSLQRRVGALERSAQLTHAAIGSGGIEVRDEGSIRFLAPDGSVLTEIDSAGVRVGADVEIDESGLQVIGGFVTPIDVQEGQDDATNESLNTNFATVASAALTFESWVETATVLVSAFGRMSVAVNKNLHIQILDDSGAVVAGPVIETVPGGEVAGGATGSVALGASYAETVSGSPIDVTLQARVNGGTSTTNSFGLTVLAFGFRSP